MRDKGVSNRAEGSWLGLASDDKGWLQLGVTREALYPGWRPWRGKNLPYGGEGSTSLLVPSPSVPQRSSSSRWHGEVSKISAPQGLRWSGSSKSLHKVGGWDTA